MTFDDVKRLARALPEVVEEASYGARALKVKKKLIVRELLDDAYRCVAPKLIVQLDAAQ